MALSVQRSDAEQARSWRADGFWRETTVYDDLCRTAAADPARTAVVSWRHTRAAVETLTYGELAAIVDRAAGGLRRLGIGEGDVVSLQLPNWWEFTVLHLACVRAGAVTHPMSPILGRRDVVTQVRAAGSRVLVVPAEHRSVSYRDLALDVAGMVPALEHVLVAGDTLESKLFAADADADACAAPSGTEGAGRADAPCELQFTSGTTGPPKGVVHTHNSVYAGTIGVARALDLTAADTFLMAATFGHQTGFLFGCCLPIMLGATAVIQDVWDPGTMLDLADRFGATWTSMPPPMVHDVCAEALAQGRSASTLKAIRTSGGPVPWSLVARTREALGAELLPSWGLTETGVCTMRVRGEPEGSEATDGAPLPGVELRYERPPTSEGMPELVVRSPGLYAGYLARGSVRPAPTWFRTGDLAESDGRGGIRIAGRSKDLIIRGGENIPVAEIESLLATHAAVADVALVAVPDLRLGERACAVVVAAAGREPTLDDLGGLLAEAGVTKHFWPERLVLVSGLPRTATGKVAKAEIRAMASRQLAKTCFGRRPERGVLPSLPR